MEPGIWVVDEFVKQNPGSGPGATKNQSQFQSGYLGNQNQINYQLTSSWPLVPVLFTRTQIVFQKFPFQFPNNWEPRFWFWFQFPNNWEPQF